MASCVLGHCDALVALRFRHLGEHFLKPGNSDNISISRILHFVHSAGLLNALQKSCTKYQLWSKFTGHFGANPYVFHSNLIYSILFHYNSNFIIIHSILCYSNSTLLYSNFVIFYSNSILF
jgi:hypothetical protein